MINISGFWHFKEEFEYGEKVGEMRIFHYGNQLSGSLVFNEKLHNGESMIVRTTISGLFSEDKITLNDRGYTILIGGSDDDYLPEEREALLNSNGQIVGSVFDNDAVGGVFVMNKIF